MAVPKLRFPEFSGEWEEKRLGDVCGIRDGTHESPKFKDDGFALITSKNLNTDGTLNFNNVSYINKMDFNLINLRLKVDIGDILFGMIGTIGNPVMVNECNFAIKNVALIKEKNKLINCYLIHYLNSNIIIKQFYENKVGGTQKFIALGLIRQLLINLPTLPEQTKIANLLSTLDKK